MAACVPERRPRFPLRPWAALGLLLVGAAAWFLRAPGPPVSDTRPGPAEGSGPDTARASSEGPIQVPPTGPETSSPRDVLLLGRLVEPGGYVPHRSLLYATRIFLPGGPKDGIVPTDDGGFSLHRPEGAGPLTAEIRTAFHAVLGSRTIVNEAASSCVEHSGVARDRTMDLGNIVIPTPDRLASQAGVVQSGGGGVVEALDVRLVGLEEIEGHRLEAADNRHALGHPPNVPARYAHEDAFLVRHIPPGKYELSLRARGHRVFRKTIDVVSGGVLPALTVILEPAPCIQGLVTDAATGGPVGQAEIRLRAGERVVGTAYTDGTGLYRVTFEEDVREGELRLQISRPGYAPGEAVVPVRLLSVARPYEQPVALKVRPEE